MPQSELPIVLYHYAYSPFARRLVWYLHLRGIPYSQCVSALTNRCTRGCKAVRPTMQYRD